MKFDVVSKENQVRIYYSKKVDKTGRYNVSNLPLWFQRLTNTEIPKIKEKKKPLKTTNNIMALIHAVPNPMNQDAPRVVSLSELPEVSLETDMRNKKLVKLCFPSI